MKKRNPVRAEMAEHHRALVAKYRAQRAAVRAAFAADPTYPARERELNRANVARAVSALRAFFETKLFPTLRATRAHVPDVLATDEKVACYWLLGKVAGNWRAAFLLAEHGMHHELMESLRSIGESLALAHHFLFGNADDLEAWFAGEIVDQWKVRQSIDKWIRERADKTGLDPSIPLEQALSGLYAMSSKFTHSSYGALLESYDVWRDDFDFDRIAGFHFIQQSDLSAMRRCIEDTLICLKHFYQYCDDRKGRSAADAILREFAPPTSAEEVSKLIEGLKRRLS